MKKLLLLSLISTFSIVSYCQNTTNILSISDTRDINDAPNFNKQAIRADFKRRAVIGVPGVGEYSGTITISPWKDATANLNHQLSFNDGGIYHRTGNFNSISWNTWQKLLLTDANGTINGKLGIGNSEPKAFFDCNETSPNSLKSVLARLFEGNNQGEGTYLGVKAYYTQETSEVGGKSFGIEHKFYGQINSSINFYRGVSTIGGHIRVNVYDGRQIAKFHFGGLDVAGTLAAREVKVEINAGADHVFSESYNLKPLSEVEAFVKENKHLPEIPSEKQMQTEGLNMNEFQIKLLQKIEELTLYVIQQEKRIQEQENMIEKLNQENKQIK